MSSLQPSAHDVLSGHLGHLTDTQQQAFTTFKEHITAANLYKPSASSDTAPSHDDATLLRFLRARRFDPVKAQEQFARAEIWRKQHDVDRLYAEFDPEEMEKSRRYYPRWTGRRSKTGLPLYVYRLASLAGQRTSELQAVPAKRRYQRIVVLYENMCRFMFPFCSFLPHPSAPTPISSTMTIIDLEGASLSSLFTLRNHLGEASSLATANYPETLHTICVVNSPSYFPTIWGWIKGWFDENTRSKIFVLGKVTSAADSSSASDAGATLRTLVDSADLPRVYGGELDWAYEDEPSLDDAAKGVLGEVPKGPTIFIDGQAKKP
ncbi:CRAL/TRIO domain-containing protein [Punctularia strigosozonata HHB-11173 SS5]|uniref:CRAL/TRIO domain-containing protein n=1 Tax=Punctularia strigosozonata (strain HHB-11173) TaxID=741275 RepID=UPI0004417446|nr:CRAL/TRIO domain-containing protein [Punctularia strigosozonata HHB-11173 SS5]EIN12397.1 CRAL/TRIO domain-containing protein [Punctularia strigosozonata HHB-11173 SS5]